MVSCVQEPSAECCVKCTTEFWSILLLLSWIFLGHFHIFFWTDPGYGRSSVTEGTWTSLPLYPRCGRAISLSHPIRSRVWLQTLHGFCACFLRPVLPRGWQTALFISDRRLSLNNIIHPVQESWHAKTCCSMLCFVLLCVYMLLLCLYFYQVLFCILDNWGRAWTHASLSIVSSAIGHNGWDAQRVTLALTEFATLLLRSLNDRDVFMRNTYVAWSSRLSGTYNYIKHICIWIW